MSGSGQSDTYGSVLAAHSGSRRGGHIQHAGSQPIGMDGLPYLRSPKPLSRNRCTLRRSHPSGQRLNPYLQEWEDFYNYHRPHGSLDGQTPYERLKQRTQTRV